MIFSIRDKISEILIMKVGLTYCGRFDRTKFTESSFDKLKKVKCYTYFEPKTNQRKGFIDEKQLKYIHLIYNLKDVIFFLYRDIYFTKYKGIITYHLGLCLKQLTNYIHLLEPDERLPSVSDEEIMLPKGLIKVEITDFIENTVHGLTPTRRSPFECKSKDVIGDRPPSILAEVDCGIDLSQGLLEGILNEKIYRLRDEGFANFYLHSLNETQKRMYSVIGCLPFYEYVTKTLKEFDGYCHPLQPHRVINRPNLTTREQILLVLMRNTSGLLYFTYVALFKWDTSHLDFYVNSVYPVLRSFQMEAIEFDEGLTDHEAMVVPSIIKEMSCEQFIERILNKSEHDF